jgi:hypothetical protein
MVQGEPIIFLTYPLSTTGTTPGTTRQSKRVQIVCVLLHAVVSSRVFVRNRSLNP